MQRGAATGDLTAVTRFRPHGVRRLLPAAAGALLALAPSALGADSHTVLVRVDLQATAEERAQISRALDADAVQALPAGWREYHVDDALSIGEARSDLSDVDAAQRVALPTVMRAAAMPDDPYLQSGQQWALRNTAHAGVDLGAVDGWPRLAGRAPVVVAVIDTGVQVSHPDLAGHIWSNTDETPGNGVDDDHNGYVDDVQGWDFAANDPSVYDGTTDRHGTHVAGIVAAGAGNGLGIAGVAPNAVVMPLKFLSNGEGSSANAARAIRYAVDNGATVINASFGGTQEDPALCDAVAWAAARGVTVVAAAGNDGADIGVTGVWPARCAEPSLITVAWTTADGSLAQYSNRSSAYVDVGAPGDVIVSTVPNGYAYMSGTSMAAPQVSGVVAAVLGERPSLTPAQRRDAVMRGGVPLPSLAATTVSGRMVSLPGALSVAAGGGEADVNPPAEFGLGDPGDAAAVAQSQPAFSWSASSDGGSGLSGYRLVVDDAVVATTDASATSAVPPTALSQGPHHWSVDAVDAAGNVRHTAARTVVVDTVAPAAPAILAPSGTVTPHITLVWAPSADSGSGVAAYEVLVDGALAARADRTATSAPLSLAVGRHRLAVRAVDGAGNAATGPERVVSVGGGAVRPGAPRVTVVTPRPIRVAGRSVVRVRAAARAHLTLVAGTRGGVPVARLRRNVPEGVSLVMIPATVARRLGPRGRIGVLSVVADR